MFSFYFLIVHFLDFPTLKDLINFARILGQKKNIEQQQTSIDQLNWTVITYYIDKTLKNLDAQMSICIFLYQLIVGSWYNEKIVSTL